VDRISRRQRLLLPTLALPMVVLLVVQMLGGLATSPSRTFFPVYITELGYTPVLVGLAVTVQQIMGLIASWVGGVLSDSLGRKRTLLLGQLGAVASAASFFVASPGLIVALRALGGFGGGLHTVAAQSYLVDMAPTANLGVLSAFFNWGYTVGGAVSSPIAGLTLERLSYGAMAWGLILCAGVAIALNQWFLVEPRLRQATAQTPAKSATLLGYGDIVRRAPLRVLAMLRFLPTFYWGMAGVLIPLLLYDAGANKMVIAWYATVSQVLAALAQVAAGHAADRLSLRRATLTATVALTLSILGLGIGAGRLWGLLVFGTVSTAAAWSLSALMPSLVARAATPEGRGRALGWVHLWWNLGMTLGALVGSALVQRSPGLPFWVAGGLNLITVALVVHFFRLGVRGNPEAGDQVASVGE
jgi:MFS family permease